MKCNGCEYNGMCYLLFGGCVKHKNGECPKNKDTK